MATELTKFNFNYNGIFTDFFDVFEPGNANVVTGFKIANGTDLGNLFASGNSGITTNYRNSTLNQDLGSLFLNKLPFSTSGAYEVDVTTSSTDTNYYYAIFRNTGTVITKKTSGNLYSICVGGGGAGGWSESGISPGGGGGGGVDYKINSLSLYPINTILTVNVGVGGIAILGDVRSGTESSLKRDNIFISRVSGGSGGNSNQAGTAGGYYDDSGLLIANGGAGGDRVNGFNSTSYSTPLDIPPALNNIIMSSYSGGGGGGKGNDQDFIYGGGGGNNGLGGSRPSSTMSYTYHNGESGLTYGAGGGAAGSISQTNFVYSGGNGANGVVIVYAAL